MRKSILRGFHFAGCSYHPDTRPSGLFSNLFQTNLWRKRRQAAEYTTCYMSSEFPPSQEQSLQHCLRMKAEGYKGFSLLEVLIALVILSIGMLSLAKLQINALTHNYNAYLYSIAASEIASIHERTIAAGATAQEITAWQKTLAVLLPQGQGEYNNDIVSVCWYNRFSYNTECLREP